MAKELFSIAAQEKKESKREIIKHRKLWIIIAWVTMIVFISRGIVLLNDFPLNLPWHVSIILRENQATLMEAVLSFLMGLSAFAVSVFLLRNSLWSIAIGFVLSLLMAGMIIYSDLSGFEIVGWRAVRAAYVVCLGLPLLIIYLVIYQSRIRRQ